MSFRMLGMPRCRIIRDAGTVDQDFAEPIAEKRRESRAPVPAFSVLTLCGEITKATASPISLSGQSAKRQGKLAVFNENFSKHLISMLHLFRSRSQRESIYSRRGFIKFEINAAIRRFLSEYRLRQRALPVGGLREFDVHPEKSSLESEKIY